MHTLTNTARTPAAQATLTALAALTLFASAPGAQALEYKLSGHVNRMLTPVDDGTQSRHFQADNVNSQTRFASPARTSFRWG